MFILSIDTKRHKGTPGYTAYILLHISLAVISIILLFCTHVVKEFIIQTMYWLTSYLFVILSISLQNKEKQLLCGIFTYLILYLQHLIYFIFKVGIVNVKCPASFQSFFKSLWCSMILTNGQNVGEDEGKNVSQMIITYYNEYYNNCMKLKLWVNMWKAMH